MQVGGKRRIVVPPKLAYVQDGLGPVPPADWVRRKIAKRLKEGTGIMVFDLELLNVWKDQNDRGYYSDLTPNPDEFMELFQALKKAKLEKMNKEKKAS